MKILLDTHVWIWHLEGNPKLSVTLKTILDNQENSLFYSPISVWEILVLTEKNKIALTPDPLTWINQGIEKLDLQEASLTTEIAILSRQLDLPHQDPADRFIAATAIHYNLILATVDANLTSAPLLQTLS